MPENERMYVAKLLSGLFRTFYAVLLRPFGVLMIRLLSIPVLVYAGVDVNKFL